MAPRALNLPPEHRFHFPSRRRILRKIFRKSVWQALVLMVFSYLLVYVFLSAGGRMNKVKAKDQFEWSPYGLRFNRLRNEKNESVVRGSFFGYVFAPLILVDRMSFHRPIPADSPEGRLLEELEMQELKEKEIEYRLLK